MKLLDVKNLEVRFFTKRGIVHAVNNVSFDLNQGETLGIIGESGCGKSVTAFSILRLVDKPGKVTGGEILFKGHDLLPLSEKQMSRLRGREIGFIAQDPLASLDPVFPIGDQIGETLKAHTQMCTAERRERVIELMKELWIPSPETRVRDYPFQFSGGMCQRVVATIAISCSPSLIIADEPTTALDVTTQAQLLHVFSYLKTNHNIGIIFITHDFGIVPKICDRVAVMYAGYIVEMANVNDIFETPYHPYTRALMDSVPRIGKDMERLTTIPGQPPTLYQPPTGCMFKERCPLRQSECDNVPPAQEVGKGHIVYCWHISPEF